MPGLLPDVDPDGLLEYSVVYTDRALNHMAQRFHRVMQDISATLKQVYGAKSAIVVPGNGSFGMEAVARQFATGKKVLVIRNGWFSYRWSQIAEMGAIPAETTVLKARMVSPEHQAPFAPPPVDEVVATIRRTKPDVVFAPQWKPRPACCCRMTTFAPWPRRCTSTVACSCWTAWPRAPSGWTWLPSAWTCW